MRNIWIGLAAGVIGLALLVTLGARLLLGAWPGALAATAGGMGAKLACSARFVTGLSAEQIRADLESYSPAYSLVDLDYSDAGAAADLFGAGAHSATYRAGQGCALDIGDTSALDFGGPGSVMATPLPRDGALDALLADMLTRDNDAGLQTRALLALRDGVVVGEAYVPGTDATTPHLGWSMAKTLTAVLIGLLERDGTLATDERGLFAQWQDERADIRVHDLLQMSSGLAFEEVYAPDADATRMLFNEARASDVARDQPLAYPIGSRFAYSSGTSNLLTRLFHERVGGTPAQAYAYLRERLLQPLGLAHTIVETDPSGAFVGSSYVYASAEDWARLGALLIQDGRHETEQLLNPAFVSRLQQPNNSSNDPRYGYQVWLNSAAGAESRWPSLPRDAFAMEGNRAQVVMMLPSERAVIVRLGWSASGYPTDERLAAIVAAL
ncbi:MAG: serine hydrolase [Pseudomonadota bacterium]